MKLELHNRRKARKREVFSSIMKRKTSKIVKRTSKKPRQAMTTSVMTLPNELLTDVFARVAAASFTDVFSTKLCCKTFQELVEDAHVYQHVSLDKFPIVEWDPLSEKQKAFLMRCDESQNPEIPYRQAVLRYFSGKRLEPGVLHYLDRALKSNHMGATYLACIVLLFSGNNVMREKGVKWLVNIKRCKNSRRILKFHRDKLAKWLREIWINNLDLRHDLVFCTREDDHKRKRGWSNSEFDEDVICEGCSVDSEIHFLREIFPRWLNTTM